MEQTLNSLRNKLAVIGWWWSAPATWGRLQKQANLHIILISEKLDDFAVYDPVNRVTLDKVGEKDKFKLTAYNEYYGPVEVTIRADQFENMACNR